MRTPAFFVAGDYPNRERHARGTSADVVAVVGFAEFATKRSDPGEAW
jgi:hypothetical protein